jgi:hypothetical protein
LVIRTGEDIIKQCFILLLIPSHPYSTGFNNNPNISEKGLLPPSVKFVCYSDFLVQLVREKSYFFKLQTYKTLLK